METSPKKSYIFESKSLKHLSKVIFILEFLMPKVSILICSYNAEKYIHANSISPAEQQQAISYPESLAKFAACPADIRAWL